MKNGLIEKSNLNQLILQEMSQHSFVAHQKHLHFKKGEDPLNSVDTTQHFYFILSGKVKVFQIDFQSSKEQILYLLQRGDMFDVVSLLDGTQREYISEVLDEVELIQVPLNDVHEMIAKDPQFRQYFYTYLANQLKSMEELAISLSFYDVYQRILQLFTRFTYMENGKVKLKVIDDLKHDDIAAMVGSVRKVVNRTLQKLKSEGAIEIARRNISIKNFQKIVDKLDVS